MSASTVNDNEYLVGHLKIKKNRSREWFRSIDLWVMGPARFHCATLLTCWFVVFVTAQVATLNLFLK